jgi:peptide/nickel transport system permease protein
MPLGLVSGYQGGSVDGVLMRMIAAMLAIPFLILAIALAAFLGPNLINAMIAIDVSQMLVPARLARAQVLAAKQKTMSRRRAPSTTRICASWRGTSSPMSFRRHWL